MLKIALVDDDRDLLMLLFLMFQTKGFEVIIYYNRQSA